MSRRLEFPSYFCYLYQNRRCGPELRLFQKLLFFNYPLPVAGGYRLQDIAAIGNYKFTLQSGSPSIGKGYTGFAPLRKVPLDPVHGVTEYTLPGNDIGCFPFNGFGNQHF